jgi:hypothetical protein
MDHRVGFSKLSLARLAVSEALAELSDTARRRVPIFNVRSDAGDLVELARDLVWQAEEVLARAVVAERANGRTWSVVAETLGLSSKQAAQQKYGAREQQWRDGLDALALGALAQQDCPEPPEAVARRLDAWVAKLRPQEAQAVSAALERSSVVEEIASFTRLARKIVGEPDAKKVRLFYAHKAALLTRIAEAEPGKEDLAAAAAQAREQLASLGGDGGNTDEA